MSESKRILNTIKIEKLLLGSLMITVLLLTIGCKAVEGELADNPSSQKEGTGSYISPFREVNGPVHMTYLIANPPIEIVTEKSESPDYREVILSIKRMKDKSVEEKINRKIMDLHNSLKEMEMPPYRGIRRLIPEGSTMLTQDVSTHLIFSAYDVISVVTSISRTYSTDESGQTVEFIDYRDTLTLDLHTGEEIRLSDLFLSDADYLERLNTLVSDYLSHQQATEEYGKEFGFITLTGPFTGLEETQKYNLSENALSLTFDCDTPEYDTRNYPIVIHIPYQDLEDIFALKERFYDQDHSIYENETAREHILIYNFQEQMQGENSITTINGIEAQKEMSYPVNLTSSLKTKFIDFSDLDVDEVTRIANEDHQQFYFQESTAYSMGDYLIFSKMKNYYDNRFIFTQEYKVFREDGTSVTMESLFKPEYDYEEIIRKVLLGAIPKGVERNEEIVSQLAESLTFTLNRTGIYFESESIEVSEDESVPVSFAIPYRIIGVENLTIFE